MLDNMRTAYDLAVLTRKMLPDGIIPVDDPTLAAHLRYRAMAHEAAKDAAPYMHPKLAAVAVSGNLGLTWEQALDQVVQPLDQVGHDADDDPDA